MTLLCNTKTSNKNLMAVKNLFTYLSAFHRLKNPLKIQIHEYPWQLSLSSIPTDHSCVKCFFEQSDADVLLEVKRPEENHFPKVPDSLEGWVKDLNDPSRDPSIIEKRLFKKDRICTEDDDTPILPFIDNDYEFFDDRPQRQTAFKEYLSAWRIWAKKKQVDEPVWDLYKAFYELDGRLKNEQGKFELYIGNGIFQGKGEKEKDVHHPLVVQALELALDAKNATFCLSRKKPPEFEGSLFQAIPTVDPRYIGTYQAQFEEMPIQPTQIHDLEAFLKGLIARIDVNGVADFKKRYKSTEQPIVGVRVFEEPWLFIRENNQGIAKALDLIKDSLATDDGTMVLPQALLRLIGEFDENKDFQSSEDDDFLSPHESENLEEEILFFKPANAEQRQIVERLNQSNCVLVQGPPGTGKTHTIANLIGHYLAEGCSILVTAAEEQALSVVREKLHESLKPLCVSVFSKEANAKKEMEHSIATIQARLDGMDRKEVSRRIRALKLERISLFEDLKQAKIELKQLLEKEFAEIVVVGKGYKPSVLAERVAEEEALHGWVAEADSQLRENYSPLSQEELEELYATNMAITHKEELELATQLPEVATLPHPDSFQEWMVNTSAYRPIAQEIKEYWQFSSCEELLKTNHTKLLQAYEQLLPTIQKLTPEQSLFLHDMPNLKVKALWEALIKATDEYFELRMDTEAFKLTENPTFTASLSWQEQELLLTKINKAYDNNQKKPFRFLDKILKRDWFQFAQTIHLQNKPLDLFNIADLEKIPSLLSLCKMEDLNTFIKERRNQLYSRLTELKPIEVFDRPEQLKLQAQIVSVKPLIAWYEKDFLTFKEACKTNGLDWEVITARVSTENVEVDSPARAWVILAATVDKIYLDLQVFRTEFEHQAIRGMLKSIERLMLDFKASSSQVTQALLNAIKTENFKAYREAYGAIIDLVEKHTTYQTRKVYLKKLEQSAPVWAIKIRERQGIHAEGNPPTQDIAEAWQWGKLNQALKVLQEGDVDSQQQKISALESQLRRNTIDLIEQQSWLHLKQKVTEPQKMALNAWLLATKKITKTGTGKYDNLKRQEAEATMKQCRTAVPVWVIPFNRIANNFEPLPQLFDVVIIDEASQLDVTALLAVYMAKKIVIVGDDKQVTPQAVAVDTDKIEALRQRHLVNSIPNSINYGTKYSIYDLAGLVFKKVMLKEHFRCVPEIIQFSNTLAYNGKIQPLRDASTVSLKPHWVGYQVTAVSQQKGRDKTNDEEAQKIVFIVKAMTQNPAYTGKTIGIIPLVGSENDQVKVIQTQLLQHLTEEQREIFQIKCATASQFQGDERDVILLSMVDKPSIDPNQPLSLVTEDGNDFRESKKYNVAVSRAKDQIWVVHSISPNALKMGDIRRQLLDYAYSQADTLKAEQEKELRKVEKAQNSEFERRVIAALMGRGYSLQAQHPVGSYSIDILVQDALTGNRLAVECDGDRWHTPDNLDEDLERQRILERCGYTFYRIRGTHFFRYPERERDKLCNKLSTFNIHPENRQSITYNENTLVQDLLKSADQFNFEGA